MDFDDRPSGPAADETLAASPLPPYVATALHALRAYLARELRELSVPLHLDGITPFQRRVYERLLEIPYGQVVTYGQIAAGIGIEPGGARAVGQAVGANPVPILIPCHRVVASDGRLAGFGGGLARKALLLSLEGVEVDGVRATSRVHPEVLRLAL